MKEAYDDSNELIIVLSQNQVITNQGIDSSVAKNQLADHFQLVIRKQISPVIHPEDQQQDHQKL